MRSFHSRIGDRIKTTQSKRPLLLDGSPPPLDKTKSEQVLGREGYFFGVLGFHAGVEGV